MIYKSKIKSVLIFLSFMIIVSLLAACADTNKNVSPSDSAKGSVGASNGEKTKESASKKNNILIAYFSRVGNAEYKEDVDAVSSASVNLTGDKVYGNAELLADMVQKETGGELFFIKTVDKYPSSYDDTTEKAKKEQEENARPKLANHVKNMESYDTVILIYPIWWGTIPMPVSTFLEEYDFSGKTILPLCTNEGSQLGSSEDDISKLCPNAKMKRGLSVLGSEVNNCEDEVEKWLKSSDVTNNET